MKNTLLLLFLLGVLVVTAEAQSPKVATTGQDNKVIFSTVHPLSIAEGITSRDLRQHLNTLASDEFEGRETGTPGNEKAAAYIADQFKAMGIPPVVDGNSYFQEVAFKWSRWEEIELQVNDKDYRHGWDFIGFPTRNTSQVAIKTREVVFLGYGIEDEAYNDYKGMNTKGKVLLIYKGEPFSKSGISR